MQATYTQLAQTAGVDLVLDLMIFGAALCIACVIGRSVLMPPIGRIPFGFLVLGGIAIGLGAFEVTWIALTALSRLQLHEVIVTASIVLLVTNAILLVRLLSARKRATR
jgi:hypothetical protein